MSPLWLLAVSLTSSLCLRQGDPDPDIPIRNIRVNPEQRQLTWDVVGPVDKISCFRGTRKATKNTTSYCTFAVFYLCQAFNYTIQGMGAHPFSTWIQYPEIDERMRGAEATNLSCRIHDTHILDCGWAVGSAAPSDVQYQLSWWRSSPKWTCEHYMVDTRGTRTGCRFPDLSGLEDQNYRVMVTGTSQAGRVPCTETFIIPSEIETLAAPNVTGSCNQSYALFKWTVDSLFTLDFIYQIQIQKDSDGGKPELVFKTDSYPYYTLTNYGPFTAKVRAKNHLSSGGGSWGAWSQPFECKEDKDSGVEAWRVAACIALGTFLTVLLVVLLFRRFSVIQRLFPPIPRMKDPLLDVAYMDRLVTWDVDKANLEDCPVEKVQAFNEK